MRKRGVLIFVLFLLVCVHAGLLAWRIGWLPSLPLLGPSPKSDVAGNVPPAVSPEKPEAQRPSFDVVRAEPTGEVIMAGRAEPGWTVSVDSNGTNIGIGVATAEGDWIIQPSKPLVSGEQSFELKAHAPGGGKVLYSRQRLMLSLGNTGKDRPLVALTEEGKATRVLQMPPDAQMPADGNAATQRNAPNVALANSKQVAFAAIDYEDAAQKSAVRMNGTAFPGARISIYIDNDYLGTATADAAGAWTYSGGRELSGGSHDVRADAVEAGTGKVIARAEVKFDREPPQQPAVAVAQAPQNSPGAVVSDETPAEGEQTREASAAPSHSRPRGKRDGAIIVRRGDTLWQIAQRLYGNGAKYTQIFQNNRGQIRNPDLIYPNQRFSMPKD